MNETVGALAMYGSLVAYIVLQVSVPGVAYVGGTIAVGCLLHQYFSRRVHGNE
jgi:hypothetical protein